MRSKILEILPNLRRFAYALTGDQFDADDIVQITVERILKSSLPENIPLLPWAIRTCKNAWIDEVRRRKRQKTEELSDNDFTLESNSGEELAINRILIDEINAAMKSLPDSQREILAMRSVLGLSYSEISKVLDIPVGTVMSRLARARSNISKGLNTLTHKRQFLNNQGESNELH